MSRSYTSSPASASLACSGTDLAFRIQNKVCVTETCLVTVFARLTAMPSEVFCRLTLSPHAPLQMQIDLEAADDSLLEHCSV
jgi:hypothetical protein